jgi:hypothetical protein
LSCVWLNGVGKASSTRLKPSLHNIMVCHGPKYYCGLGMLAKTSVGKTFYMLRVDPNQNQQ